MDNKEQNEEVLTDEQVVDELADWFKEAGDDEDPSASDDYEYDDDSSPSEDEEESDPEDKDQDSDAEPASEEGTSEGRQPTEDNPYAWIDELDPQVRKKAEALAHASKSDRGRVAALTRRLDEIQARQTVESTQRAAPKSATPTGKDIEDMTDDELRQFEEEFPTVSRNMKKIIEQRVAREREEILGQVRPFQQQIQQQQLIEQKEALRRNAEVIFNTEETGLGLDDVLNSPRWREWLSTQPKGYQQFALAANTVEDASKVLEDFAVYADQEVRARYTEEEPQPQTSSKADQTAARRKQARTGSTPKSRSAQLADRGNSSAYEDYFNEAVEGG